MNDDEHDDDYPTAEQLEKIREWPPLLAESLFEYVRSLWHWPAWATRITEFEGETGDFHRFATGGWSGNESLIEAISRNESAWMLWWYLSKRGGLHVFRVK